VHASDAIVRLAVGCEASSSSARRLTVIGASTWARMWSALSCDGRTPISSIRASALWPELRTRWVVS